MLFGLEFEVLTGPRCCFLEASRFGRFFWTAYRQLFALIGSGNEELNMNEEESKGSEFWARHGSVLCPWTVSLPGGGGISANRKSNIAHPKLLLVQTAPRK